MKGVKANETCQYALNASVSLAEGGALGVAAGVDGVTEEAAVLPSGGGGGGCSPGGGGGAGADGGGGAYPC